MPYGDWTLDTNTPTWYVRFSYPKIAGFGDTVYEITHGLVDESQEDSDVAFQTLLDMIEASPIFVLQEATKSAPTMQQVTPTEVVSDGN